MNWRDCVRALGLGLAAVSLAGCAFDSLEQARRNYPPLILGANTRAADGAPPYARACPAGGRVEQKGGPTMEYLGASAADPELCRMRVGGEVVEGWFGIWLTDWPGAEQAHGALGRIIRGRTGDVEAFDVRRGADFAFHDLIRNEGVEDIRLLGVTYRALKLSHYREGAEGNIYRSVSTVWKDIPTGLLIYGTYQHISGAPEIEDPLLPTAIIPGR